MILDVSNTYSHGKMVKLDLGVVIKNVTLVFCEVQVQTIHKTNSKIIIDTRNLVLSKVKTSVELKLESVESSMEKLVVTKY